MKDVVFNTKMAFLQQALSTGTRFLQVDQQPSMMRWLVAMRLLRHVRSLNKQIKAIALPGKIETTPQYMQVMYAMDQLEEVLDFLKTLPSDQVMPGDLRRAVVSVGANAYKKYELATLLIQPFDPTPQTNYFFEKQDQRDIWKRRNKNYVYLNLQEDNPTMAGLEAALDALTADSDKH
jgi:hypothetical protein